MQKNDVMDYLPRMVIFSRVVEMGSFSGAASALGLSSSSVSQHISALEAAMGMTLLHRTTRKLSLTEAGQTFYANCARILMLAAEARQNAENLHKDMVGEVRISTSSFMASEYLVPALEGLLHDYPKLRINIDVNDHNVDLIEKSVDIALRAGKAAGPEDVFLARLDAVLCAAPAYLQGHSPIRTPEDLRSHEFIFFTPLGTTMELGMRDGAGRLVQMRLTPRISVNHTHSLHKLTLQGHGVARLLQSKVQSDLDNGRLQRVLPDWTLDGYCAFLSTNYRGQVPQKVVVCVEHIRAYFRRRHPVMQEA
ncbi:LysR family transcriptional regulator [Herbaspirillum sp. BH-1]|uniref:DNA-binding transcriptional LysR family regulator n=1 Tax=Herbaspirillum frisingense TaxID=92645 RepID=A0ABU1PBH6_9BURK|nr:MULTISPECIES: LysR family transcriptional regulator [Herbaspirillum]MDR6583284.1 DNA-binding transcriptional LysR family regulator [Herbaspirillum frisingense]PLY60196.1 LysR family transcriptional regulator [Herbaspirillum sp. BH-1]